MSARMVRRHEAQGRVWAVLAAALALGLGSCTAGESPTGPAPGAGALQLAKHRSSLGTWTPKAALVAPSYQFGLDAIAAGTGPKRGGESIVYVLGGFPGEMPGLGFGLEAYDLRTNSWTEKISRQSGGLLSRTNGIGTIDGKLFVSGGGVYNGDWLVSPRLVVYDPATNTVTRKADLPKATTEGVTGVIHRRLYVLPGYCDGMFWPSPEYCEEGPIRELYRYDPDTDTWDIRQPAPHFHRNGVGGVIHDKFYVAGGLSSADLDVYDPKTDTWTSLAPVPTPGAAVGAVLEGKLYLIMPPHTYAYDPATDTWESKAPYPSYAPQAVTPVTLRGRKYLLAVGGSHDPSAQHPLGLPNESELFEP